MLPALIGISGHEVGAEEEAAIRRWQPAGFILFSRNIDSVEQVRGLTESLRKLCLHHPVIAVDQEGGRVVRTASLGLNLPSPASLARLGSVGGIVELGAVTALALRYLGVNLNFAPVLDICHDPSAANALPGRCWGDNAQDVISRGGVYASNLRRGGVQSCGKHFPGMGLPWRIPISAFPWLTWMNGSCSRRICCLFWLCVRHCPPLCPPISCCLRLIPIIPPPCPNG